MTRILLDLQTGDDPIWTYFDSQHKHILSQMNKTYRASVSSIKCMCNTDIKGFYLIVTTAVIDKTTPETTGPGSLTITVAAQIQNAVLALESKQPDVIIGTPSSLVTSTPLLTSPFRHVARSSAEPVWQAILDMVKNISETMLANLPNFWKIAKGFMEGRYRKVGIMLHHLNF